MTVIINSQIIKNNPNEERLSKYLNRSYLEQKKFYESLGYKCNVIES